MTNGAYGGGGPGFGRGCETWSGSFSCCGRDLGRRIFRPVRPQNGLELDWSDRGCGLASSSPPESSTVFGGCGARRATSIDCGFACSVIAP